MDFIQMNGRISSSQFSQELITKRPFLEYSPPPEREDLKQIWLQRNEDLISDLKWFIKLDFNSFWSQIIYDSQALNIIVSFLQEAHPIYLLNEFPKDKEIWKSYQSLAYLVLLFIYRLSVLKESDGEFMEKGKYAKIIYDNYIFSIPMILDICLHFGEMYDKQISKIVDTIFNVQPLYLEDLSETIQFTLNTLKNIELDLEIKPVVTTNGEVNKLPLKGGEKLTLKVFKDIVLHSLDTIYSLRMFLTIYKPACKIFHQHSLELNLVNFYENVIPEMFKKFELFFKQKNNDMKNKLNLLRLEILKLVNCILDSCCNLLIEERDQLTDAEIKIACDDYLSIISESISEKLFICDFHNLYPMDVILDTLQNLNPEIDRLKYDYIMESIQTAFDVKKQETKKISNDYIKRPQQNAAKCNETKKSLSGVEWNSLITEIKDIFSHLGEGFISKCLEHFDYSTENVIHAILEDRLPESLKLLDPEMENEEITENEQQDQRYNIYDNDEFDFMTRDYIDPEKVILGKKESKFKDLKDLIDDKSFRGEYREMYTKLSIIQAEENVYDDEYDDTYDIANISIEEAGESERRPFVVPRVLQTNNTKEESEGESEDEETTTTTTRSIDNDFVQNPEEIRAKQEARRQQIHRAKAGPSTSRPSRDVVGKPKGQGQTKETQQNRNHKTVNKSSKSNHNRRIGAQRKRNQGMMPS